MVFAGRTSSAPGPTIRPCFHISARRCRPGGQIFLNDRISNPYRISLPAYQSIFAGETQDCSTNNCGRITSETFPERLVRELNLEPKKVATLASWNQIACAVESRPKSTFVNAGDLPLMDGTLSVEQQENNRLQQRKRWQSEEHRRKARLDEHTFRHAKTYLRRHRPNFLFISFLDSDIYGHAQDLPGYWNALVQYDQWLKELVEILDSMGDYGRKTTVIVTTDHGRGSGGRQWGEHGAAVPESEQIWTYVRLAPNNNFKIADAVSGHEHVDIRPTVETLFGLRPQLCWTCGTSFVVRR